LIFRALKGLEHVISLSVVHWFMADQGWTFQDGPGVIPDPVSGAGLMQEVYILAKPDYTGRVTVPVLWDRQTNTIVNNESAEIIRMLNEAFNAFATKPELDFYPHDLREEIHKINAWVYADINNGVYRCGFATSQEAYEEAVVGLFGALDRAEALLAERRYLTGDQITEADWRLFTTLVRFDPVYVGHFKCNLRRLIDYPNLWNYVLELYQHPGVAKTVNLAHIKDHYYQSQTSINPHRVVPKGPVIDYSAPHDRGQQDTG